jgi:hypothetical protein
VLERRCRGGPLTGAARAVSQAGGEAAQPLEERPAEQLGPVDSRRLLLHRLLAGRCLGRLARLLRSRLGEREERLDVLDKRMVRFGLKPEGYQWYRDLRRYGTVPHAGFGLGFERLIVYICGLQNIRDAIPYPRVPSWAQF